MRDGLHYIQKLSNDMVAEIQALEKHYNLTKNIFFKIDPQALVGDCEQVSHILYREEDDLKGYACLNCFNGEEMECTVIIEDDEVVFLKIYDLILQKAKELKAKKLLLIIDTNNGFLAGIVKKLRFTLSFAEYRMNFDETKFNFHENNDIDLQSATENDIEFMAQLDQVSFGNSLEIEGIKGMLRLDLKNTKIAKLNGGLIGKIRIDHVDGVVGIYGFVVDPKRRGQGLGRKILISTIREILDSDFKKLYLEV